MFMEQSHVSSLALQRRRSYRWIPASIVCLVTLAHTTFVGQPAGGIIQRLPARNRGYSSILSASKSWKVDGTIEPLGSYVLVKVGAAEEQTQGGLLLSKSEKPRGGDVVAVGPGEASSESGVVTPISVKTGDKVVYSRYSGSDTVDLAGSEHVLVREDELLVSYKGDNPQISSISMPRGKVLVKLLAKEEATSFGLLLSKGATKQSTTVGEVVAVGAGEISPKGEEITPPVAVGDMVRFRYGDEVDMDIDDDKYSVVRISNCIAKWKAA